MVSSSRDWFSDQWFSAPRLMGGLMSGTSLDGIDAAVVEFYRNGDNHAMRLKSSIALDFPPAVAETLKAMTKATNIDKAESVSIIDVSTVHTGLSHLYAEAVRKACVQAGVAVNALEAVGMHGQTVWHQPTGVGFGETTVRSTLQLGSPSILANLLGVPVVGDFRAADMALGGQAAPLAPMFDYHFLRKADENVIALNLGGIANITIIPAGASEERVIAFDTGPSNLLIDASTLKFFGKRYDTGGSIGAAGRVLSRFMEALKDEPYITLPPPKSTGRELFNKEFLEKALEYTYFDAQPAEDVVRTVTEYTAWSVAENIRRFAVENNFIDNSLHTRIIAGGGGTNNPCLMDALRRELPDMTVETTDAYGIPADGKEAIFFGYLAYRTLGGLHGNLPSVTGASRKAILGSISIP